MYSNWVPYQFNFNIKWLYNWKIWVHIIMRKGMKFTCQQQFMLSIYSPHEKLNNGDCENVEVIPTEQPPMADNTELELFIVSAIVIFEVNKCKSI